MILLDCSSLSALLAAFVDTVGYLIERIGDRRNVPRYLLDVLSIFLNIHDGKCRISAKIAPASERYFRISAVDRFKLHVDHSECYQVLAYLARFGVLRWGFSLLHSFNMGFLLMMTGISEGRFLGNEIAFSGTVCYNLGVRVSGRLDSNFKIGDSIMTELFSTDRLLVRKFTPEDHEDLADILTDNEVTYFEPYDTFTREACVQEAINFSNSDEFYAVVLEGKVIGKIYFSDKGYGSYEIGYTFNKSFQGNGYASESIKGMMKYAFNILGVRRIFAEIDTRNDKSIRLVERVGMRKEAEHKELFPRKGESDKYNDFFIYAILKKNLTDLLHIIEYITQCRATPALHFLCPIQYSP